MTDEKRAEMVAAVERETAAKMRWDGLMMTNVAGRSAEDMVSLNLAVAEAEIELRRARADVRRIVEAETQ